MKAIHDFVLDDGYRSGLGAFETNANKSNQGVNTNFISVDNIIMVWRNFFIGFGIEQNATDISCALSIFVFYIGENLIHIMEVHCPTIIKTHRLHGMLVVFGIYNQ